MSRTSVFSLTEPEFARVLKVGEREAATLPSILRDAWDRGELRTMTKNSPLHATGAHITMIAHITEPYLQFGEVQWWYFAAGSGMPFYDSYTTSTFQARYGKPMAAILSQNADPSGFPDECAFLPEVIGEFTNAMMTHVRQAHADARFEVLYPPDVNDTALNRLVNFPHAHWTPASLDSLKTENFTYTGDRDLDKALASIELPIELGFGRSQSSHLVGIGEYTTPWSQEQRMATGEQLDSVVLFALDQFCLIGYRLPLERAARRARYMGR